MADSFPVSAIEWKGVGHFELLGVSQRLSEDQFLGKGIVQRSFTV
jgi:hypothetical protein